LFLSFALVLGFALPSQAATGTKAVPSKKKHPGHTVKGVVVEVHHDKAKGHGEIKIKVHQKSRAKKNSTSAAAAASKKKKTGDHVVTVHVNLATKFEKVVHHQGTVQRHKAGFAGVHKGEHVHVHVGARNQHAKEVDIVVHQHKTAPPTPPAKKPLKK